MRKIAIIADIHANIIYFKKVLEDIQKRGINDFIFLGDYVLDGFDNNEILELIKKQNSLAIIMGNKEEFFFDNFDISKYNCEQFKNIIYTYKSLSKENLEYIKKLPIYVNLEIEGVKILCCHGAPDFIRDSFGENDYEKFDDLINKYNFDVYLHGHTHLGYYKEYNNHYFINPSSLGMPLDGVGARYGIKTIEGKENITYEQIILEHDYEKLEKYYKESKYYEEVGNWAKLALMNLKDGKNYTLEFVNRVRKLSNIDTKNVKGSVSDELWNSEFKRFIKEKKLEEYV